MRKLFKGLASILILGTIGCASERGVIVNKQHLPEKRWIEVKNLALSNGKNYEPGKVPIYCVDDEDFIVEVNQKQGKEKYYLKSKLDYDQSFIGDQFEYNSNIAEKNDPLIKRRLNETELRSFIKNGKF